MALDLDGMVASLCDVGGLCPADRELVRSLLRVVDGYSVEQAEAIRKLHKRIMGRRLKNKNEHGARSRSVLAVDDDD
jgi:hypothetical protein